MRILFSFENWTRGQFGVWGQRWKPNQASSTAASEQSCSGHKCICSSRLICRGLLWPEGENEMAQRQRLKVKTVCVWWFISVRVSFLTCLPSPHQPLGCWCRGSGCSRQNSGWATHWSGYRTIHSVHTRAQKHTVASSNSTLLSADLQSVVYWSLSLSIAISILLPPLGCFALLSAGVSRPWVPLTDALIKRSKDVLPVSHTEMIDRRLTQPEKLKCRLRINQNAIIQSPWLHV